MDTTANNNNSNNNGTLKNRFRPGSSSVLDATSDTNANIIMGSKNKPRGHGLRRPFHHSSSAAAAGHNAPPQSPRYALPCFRTLNQKSKLLVILAVTALSLSIMTAFLGTMSLSSMSMNSNPSGVHFLPSAKEWGDGREKRRRERKQRREFGKDGELIHRVSKVEYEDGVLDFITRLNKESKNSPSMQSVLQNNPNLLGQDMGIYAKLGCSVLNQTSSNTATFSGDNMQQLWSSHLSSILDASRHADDPNFSHKNWTKTLLKSISPYSLLENNGQSESSSGNGNARAMHSNDKERIIGILVKRVLGLLQNNNNNNRNSQLPPPPLRIAVFGGPTVEGKGCHRARVEIPHGSIMANPSFCAFPYRLEQFLNAILLPPGVLKRLREHQLAAGAGMPSNNEDFRMVEVLNLGEEGTNSDFSASIVRNRMYPPLANAGMGFGNSAFGYGGGPPDLIIHAYGIDDYGKEATDILPFYDSARRAESDASKNGGCSKENRKPPPVIIRALLERGSDQPSSSLLSMMTTVLGDVLDDVEEGEMTLPVMQTRENKEEEAGAFGMAGHIATSWALAFDLAHAAMSHCAVSNADIPSKAVTQLENTNHKDPAMCDNGIDPPCTFSFLAGPKGTASRPSVIASTLMQYVVENTGWQPESDMTAGFARKTGLVGSGTGASLTLLFQNVTRPIRRFDVITLRSTSALWKGGLAQFVLVTGGDFSHGSEAAEASAKAARETTFEISADLIAGSSDNEGDQHISYHFGLDLVDGENIGALGTDVLLRITLSKGNKFKILGLMLCE